MKHRMSIGPPALAIAAALAAPAAHRHSDHVIRNDKISDDAGDGGSSGIDAGTRI